MKGSVLRSLFALAASAAFRLTPVSAQTSTTCNPLTSGSCPPDPALGKSVTIDFTKGASDMFTSMGNPSFDGNGASFTVAKSGDSPLISSKFYIMFGRVEVTMKAAPGVGIVSSAVLQSDDLDEIDWEWLGGDSGQVQTNYFGKGQTTTYNRGAFHPAADNQAKFKTYTIDWNADQIVWQIDGTTVRSLSAASAAGQYPQTPMQIKLGSWSGGDSANAPGTVQWAGGPTNYAAGPYSMVVKSISIADYSTGTQYVYGDSSGSWQSIQAVGGKVNGKGGDGGSSATAAAAPSVTSASPAMPYPFEGTHQGTSSTYTTPSIYPWVAAPSTLQASASATASSYPGLPAGWTVTDSGKVVPPSSAANTGAPASYSPASGWQASGSAAGGPEMTTSFNQQGFPTVVPVAAGGVVSYDSQGFVVSTTPAAAAEASQGGAQAQFSQGPSTATAGAYKPRADGALLVAACALAAGVLLG
ncbi:MAG: hypothetical protein M1832_002347 [Thelocarpon impressellum]|nr:MAG: hypothetical protein M1832_002347 [Thelocarpon impressellum]